MALPLSTDRGRGRSTSNRDGPEAVSQMTAAKVFLGKKEESKQTEILMLLPQVGCIVPGKGQHLDSIP